MAWSNVTKAPLVKAENKRDTPDGLWHKCGSCQQIIYRPDYQANQYVCTQCKHHDPMPARERLARFLDQDSFKEEDADIVSGDPLEFVDRKSYPERLAQAAAKTGCPEAIICGGGSLHGIKLEVGAYEFAFMGGSMGSAVGEKIARLMLRSLEKKRPAVIFSASGGARMQEGILSLMQMAKTCAVLAQLKDAGIPMISVLTHPTTGGVAASYAMLGDVNIAEPGALIGFAGPRVIQQTMREKLPEGFQTAEYLLEHGMVDMICHRETLRDKIAQILKILCHRLPLD